MGSNSTTIHDSNTTSSYTLQKKTCYVTMHACIMALNFTFLNGEK